MSALSMSRQTIGAYLCLYLKNQRIKDLGIKGLIIFKSIFKQKCIFFIS